MAGFWQSGQNSGFQRLRDRSIEDLNREITAIALRRKVVLLLPALFSEFDTPAMPEIIAELKKVNYLHAVILSLDNANIQEARISIEKYHALSLINGPTYDRHTEIEAVEAFVDSLRWGISEFVEDPVGIPMLPAWARVSAGIPDFQDRLSEFVARHNSVD
jgi:hypothetical protein